MTLIEELRGRREYLITSEAMSLLRMSHNTLCAIVRSGRIPAIRAGNGYLFDPESLSNYLESRITTPNKSTTRTPCVSTLRETL